MTKDIIDSKNNTIVNKPYKKKIFRLFVIWCSIPSKLRELDPEKAQEFGINIKSSVFKDLLMVETQKEFSEKFNISEETLSKWKKREDFNQALKETINKGVKQFKKDVDFSFTQKTIQYGDKGRVELWKKLFEGWTDKKELSISGEISLLIDELSDEDSENLVK